jgi:anti-sigma regulatory factor (Ser/Thr protein kinase)
VLLCLPAHGRALHSQTAAGYGTPPRHAVGFSAHPMPDALPHAFQLEVPADLVFVRPVRKMVEGLLYAQGWVEDDVDDVALIITEIVQNAVEHGSKADGSESIRVQVHTHADAIELEVLDPGTGEDPRVAVDRDVVAAVPMDEVRGRGLFLINRLSGLFERDIHVSGGLCVRVRKEIGS